MRACMLDRLTVLPPDVFNDVGQPALLRNGWIRIDARGAGPAIVSHENVVTQFLCAAEIAARAFAPRLLAGVDGASGQRRRGGGLLRRTTGMSATGIELRLGLRLKRMLELMLERRLELRRGLELELGSLRSWRVHAFEVASLGDLPH